MDPDPDPRVKKGSAFEEKSLKKTFGKFLFIFSRYEDKKILYNILIL